MKKFLFILISFVFMVTSCGVKMTGYDFEKTLKADKELVDSLSGADLVRFCEAQARFSKDFNKSDKEFEVLYMQTVFQVDSLVYILKHPDGQYGTEPAIEVYEDIWIGDLYSPIECDVDLRQAITNIKKSDLEAPATPFVVLRRPIMKPPFPKYMYYIFGSSQKGALKVDSHTGEVTNL